MPYTHVDLKASAAQDGLARVLEQLRPDNELSSEFPAEVLAEAERAIAAQQLPARDLTALEFVTIDPPSSTDLDQALLLERDGSGYKVWYAIADVPSFIIPGGALDAETRRRGQTIYLPDGRVPLHPESISEDAGSLLPGRLRSAYVWELWLDAAGAVTEATVARAQVRSRAKLDYATVQREIDAGTASGSLLLLKEIGQLRVAQEQARGGASLRIPEQEIELTERGYIIVQRAPEPVEDWNAQISLMTGMAAAQIMLKAGIGLLRTMPAPDEKSLEQYRRQTRALGKPWEPEVPYGDYLRSLDVTEPRQLALMHEAASLFRGAGYAAFDGAPPAATMQSAIAAAYAHTTAPLRRLVDRFVLVICDHLVRGESVPEWVRRALPALPGIMAASNQLTGRLERLAVDAVEAALLAGREGEVFEGVAINGQSEAQAARAKDENRESFGTVQLLDPVVTAKFDGAAEIGTAVKVRLVEANIQKSEVRFTIV